MMLEGHDKVSHCMSAVQQCRRARKPVGPKGGRKLLEPPPAVTALSGNDDRSRTIAVYRGIPVSRHGTHDGRHGD
eukprot:10713564-Lingulodinium_polyedra.AAC.1